MSRVIDGLVVHALGIEGVALDDCVTAGLYLKVSIPENDMKSKWSLFTGQTPQLISPPALYPIPLSANTLPSIQAFLDLPTSDTQYPPAKFKPEVTVSSSGVITISNTGKSERRSTGRERSTWLIVLEIRVELAIDDHGRMPRWMTIIPLPPCLNNKIRFRISQEEEGELEISAQPKIYPSGEGDGILQGSFQSTNQIRLEWSYPPDESSNLSNSATVGGSNQDESFQTLRTSSPIYPPSKPPTPSSTTRLTGLRNQQLPSDMTIEDYTFEMESAELARPPSSTGRRVSAGVGVGSASGTPTPSGRKVGNDSEIRRRVFGGIDGRGGDERSALSSEKEETPTKSRSQPLTNGFLTSPSTSTAQTQISPLKRSSPSNHNSDNDNAPPTLHSSSPVRTPQTPAPNPVESPNPRHKYLLTWSSLFILFTALLLLISAREIQRMRFEQYKVMMEVRDLRGVLDTVLAERNRGTRGDGLRWDGGGSGGSSVGHVDVEDVDALWRGRREEVVGNAVGRVVVRNKIWDEWIRHPTVQSLRGGIDWIWRAIKFALIG